MIGAWHGNGRKAGWHSPYLLACWDPETGGWWGEPEGCMAFAGSTWRIAQVTSHVVETTPVAPPRLPWNAEELQSVCRCMSGFSDAFYKDALVR